MQTALLLSLLSLLIVLPVGGQQPEELPALKGIVTRAASPSDFDVNTVRIVCDEKTLSGWSHHDEFTHGCPATTPKIGESVTIFGKRHKDQNVLEASRIVEHPVKYGDVSGSAVIDAPPIRNAPGQPPGTIMVRADGYWIIMPLKSDISFWGALKSVNDVAANTWIEYRGKMRADGVVVGSHIWLTPNTLTDKEVRRRVKTHYDPTSASAETKQSSIAIDIEGIRLNRVPPWPDSAMQSRVAAVGSRLIPEFQKRLPDSDPTKLAFRFITVDANWGEFPITLPDGTILVPYKCVGRVQNDSQLAALLADAVAAALEKQKLRVQTTASALTRAELASSAVSFIPGPVGIAAAGYDAFSSDQRAILRGEMEQSERVSLMLMHDAGYDITQAPLAWWLLSSGKKPLSATEPPPASVELYRTIAAVWSQPSQTRILKAPAVDTATR